MQQSFLIGLCVGATSESEEIKVKRMGSLLFAIDLCHKTKHPSSPETCCLSRGTPERFEHVAFWNEKENLDILEESARVRFEAMKRQDRMDKAWEQPAARPKPPRF